MECISEMPVLDLDAGKQGALYEPALIFGLRPSYWAIGGAVLSCLGWYLVRAIGARNMSLDLYGVFSLVISTQVTISAFSDFGMTYGLSKLIPGLSSLEKSKRKEAARKIFHAGILIQAFIIALIVAAEILLSVSKGLGISLKEDFGPVFIASIPWFAATSCCVFLEAVASSLQRFDIRAIALTGRIFWMVFGMVLILVFGTEGGISGLCGIFLFSAIFGLIPVVAGVCYFWKKSLSLLPESCSLLS